MVLKKIPYLCFIGCILCIQCFAGQAINITVPVGVDVAGNGNAAANGIGPFDQSPIGNTITLGAVANGNVYGSYSMLENKVSKNIINIDPLSSVGREIYGGRISNGTVSENTVNYNSNNPTRSAVYGGRIDNNGLGLDNIVNISIDNADIGANVYGCRSIRDAEKMSGNIVNINIGVGSIRGEVFGAVVNTANAQTEISNNKVIIKVSSGNFIAFGLSGAQIEHGECKFEGNEAIVDINGTIGGYIFGVETLNCASAFAYNNNITINNGICNNEIRLYGASVDGHGDVVDNSITINNGVFKNTIIGGITGRALYITGTGNATGNLVTINDGVITHDVSWTGGIASILGGSSGGGNSTENKIIINGGTIKADRIFAAESDGGNTTNNTVTIQGNAKVDVDLLCGGFVWNNPDADKFTGNTLNLGTTGIMCNGLDHFENYNFYLQENKCDIPMIIIRQGGDVLSVNGFSPKATGGAVNLENTNINVYTSSSSKVNIGDSYILIRSTNGISGTPKHIDSFVQKGLAVCYNCDIKIVDTDLVVQISQDSEVNPVFPRGYSAGIAFSNLGADLIVGEGMQKIVNLNNTNKDTVNSFGIFSGQKYNYGGDSSQVNIEGIFLLAGLTAKLFDIKSNPFINGLFFEYGNSNFDFKKESSNMSLVKSRGDTSYAGGGILGRLEIKHNVYCESFLRIGQTKVDFNNSDLKDSVTGVEAKYNYDSLYFGLHLGGGYIYRFNNNLRADFYGKYIFAHQDAKNVLLPTEEELQFDGINSQRIKIGTRVDYLLDKKNVPDVYAGIALNNEFDGEVKTTIDNISSINSSLRGSDVTGELGLTKSIGQLNLDLGVQGYTGNKKGFSGTLKVVYAF